MIDTAITIDCARAVGRIADAHAEDDACIRIRWREVDAEQTWLVIVDGPDADAPIAIYVVDDETGTHAPLTEDEKARLYAGVAIFADEAKS